MLFAHGMDKVLDDLPEPFEVTRDILKRIQLAAVVNGELEMREMFEMLFDAVMTLEKRVLLLEGKIEPKDESARPGD